MARFFQTAPTQFVEDFIYQPPWQLIQQATAKKQQEYDNMLAQAKLFDNLPIQHLQGEDDVYNIQEKQRYYSEKANQIAQAIKKDPASVNKYLPNIEALSKELQQDYTTGDISKIQGSYNAYQQWQKDNEQLKKDDPSRYTAANAYFLNEYAKDGGNSINKSYKGDLVTKGLDYEALRKSMSELKASSVKSTTTTPAGNLYLVERGGKKEQLTEDELTAWLQAQVVTPENLASLRQSQQFGLGTYTDAEGKIDWKGGSLFTPLRGMASAAAYSNEESEIKYSGDSAAIARMNEDGQNRRWAIDRQDKLIKQEKDRIDAANKTKEDKINAYDIKIAEAQIAGDDKGATIWTNAKNNLTGTGGIYQSNLGSQYGSVKALQQASAGGDKVAQKLLSQNLNDVLKKAGIDFKDPRQKAIAQDLVGKIKQNKIDVNSIGDYLDKIVPASYSNQLSISEKNRANKEYSEALKPLQDAVRVSEMKLSNTRKTLNELKKLPENTEDQKLYKKQQINKAQILVSEWEKDLENKRKKVSSINKDSFSKSILESNKRNSKDYNEGFRNTFEEKIKGALENLDSTWQDRSKFSTTYETAPLNITAQSTIKSILRDPEINKEMFIEDNGKLEPMSMTKFNILQNIVSVTTPDGKGRYGVIALDKTGKQYKITANVGTPAYTAIMNIAKSNVNPNTPVGLSIMYPSTGIVKQQIEARKTLGQSNVQFDIRSAGGNNYTIKQVGNTDKYNVYDSFGNLQNRTGPVDYIQAGVGIDKNDNK